LLLQRLLFMRFVCLLALLFSPLLLSGESVITGSGRHLSFHRISLGGGYHYVHPHHQSLNHLARGLFPVYHLGVSWQTTGDRSWHHIYHFPELGAGVFYASLGYPEVLGEAFALLPHIRLPLIRRGLFGLHMTHGLGAAWLTKPFHRFDNYRNIAIGSGLNIAYQAQLEGVLSLGRGGELAASLGFVHFSNGSIRRPNRGLNMPGANLSYAFVWPGSPALPARERPAFKGSTTITTALAGGVSRSDHLNDTLMSAFSYTLTASRSLSNKHRLGIGGDLFVNYADKDALRKVMESEPQRADLLKGGIHLSYEQSFGQIDFLLQTGLYLKELDNEDGPVYNRTGFRYHAGSSLFVHLCLTSHLFRASFVEAGVGYRWRSGTGRKTDVSSNRENP
jgi:hypothetical protein